MNLFKKIAVTAGILAVSIPALAFEFDYNAAEDYNVYTFGNFYGKDGSTQGRIASGGSVSLYGYNVVDPNSWPAGEMPSNEEMGLAIVAAGAGVFSNATIHAGDALFNGGGTFSNAHFSRDVYTNSTSGLFHNSTVPGTIYAQNGYVDQTGNTIGGTAVGNLAVPENFITAKQYFTNYSTTLSNYSTTGNNARSDYDDKDRYLITLTGDGSSDPQVFYLTADDLANAYDISLVGIGDTNSVIINVDGANIDMAALNAYEPNGSIQNPNSIFLNNDYDALFNFYNATEVNVDGMNVYGTMLAPLGTIYADNGSITGKIIANNFWSNENFNFYEVDTTPAVPEPSTYLMMVAGLGMIGVIARRRIANKN